MTPRPDRPYDAVIVPGGGLDDAGAPHPWVRARLDYAAQLILESQATYAVVLSRGTTHRPPPTERGGVPIDEATASARYLVARGVDAGCVLMDRWSLDTIGNAFFARVSICEPLGLGKLLVVTNTFHMDRVRVIFDWVASLLPRPLDFQMTYAEVPNDGMSDEVALARAEKECRAVANLEATKAKVGTQLSELVRFLMVEHAAYSTAGVVSVSEAVVDRDALKSY